MVCRSRVSTRTNDQIHILDECRIRSGSIYRHFMSERGRQSQVQATLSTNLARVGNTFAGGEPHRNCRWNVCLATCRQVYSDTLACSTSVFCCWHFLQYPGCMDSEAVEVATKTIDRIIHLIDSHVRFC